MRFVLFGRVYERAETTRQTEKRLYKTTFGRCRESVRLCTIVSEFRQYRRKNVGKRYEQSEFTQTKTVLYLKC